MSFLGGSRAGRTITPRNILMASDGAFYLPGPNILDANTAADIRSYDGGNTSYEWELRAGCIMAQVTATRKWVPCKRTTVAAGGSGSGSGAGSAVMPVVNAAFFVVGEVITITGTSAGTVTKTITAIDYTNNLITFSGAIQYNTGSIVTTSTFDGGTSAAGAEIPRAILAETVWTKNLTDPIDAIAGTLYDKPIQLLRAGYVDVNYILGDFAACRDATVNYLGGFQWGDRQQGNV